MHGMMASCPSSLSQFVIPCRISCSSRGFIVYRFNCSSAVFRLQSLEHLRRYSLYASLVESSKIDLSWVHSHENVAEGFGGWLFQEEPRLETRKSSPLVHLGISFAIFMAAFCGYQLSGHKCDFIVPWRAHQRLLLQSSSKDNVRRSVDVHENNVDGMLKTVQRTAHRDDDASVSGKEVALARLLADSAQQEAVLILKKLKIIEESADANDLCTRREYARWLVKTTCLLERNQKHSLVPSMLVAGAAVTAFDDVHVTDSDFWCIQTLAEAGILTSKLIACNSSLECQGRINFFPERFISRFDMLNWKIQLEYLPEPGLDEKMLKRKMDFMDMKRSDLDIPSGLLRDNVDACKSITSKVFGRSRRLQPWKPVTNAQAAVALISGRLLDAGHHEVCRLETEKSSILAEREKIRAELLSDGEIERFWEAVLNEERTHVQVAERNFITALYNLKKEKVKYNKWQIELLMERSAFTCKQEVLHQIKEEIYDVSERLASEKSNLEAEKQFLRNIGSDLQARKNALTEARSILEAKKYATQVVRAWIENEAQKNLASADMLEEAAQRWRWTSK